jgi:hypothetical protein
LGELFFAGIFVRAMKLTENSELEAFRYEKGSDTNVAIPKIGDRFAEVKVSFLFSLYRRYGDESVRG